MTLLEASKAVYSLPMSEAHSAARNLASSDPLVVRLREDVAVFGSMHASFLTHTEGDHPGFRWEGIAEPSDEERIWFDLLRVAVFQDAAEDAAAIAAALQAFTPPEWLHPDWEATWMGAWLVSVSWSHAKILASELRPLITQRATRLYALMPNIDPIARPLALQALYIFAQIDAQSPIRQHLSAFFDQDLIRRMSPTVHAMLLGHDALIRLELGHTDEALELARMGFQASRDAGSVLAASFAARIIHEVTPDDREALAVYSVVAHFREESPDVPWIAVASAVAVFRLGLLAGDFVGVEHRLRSILTSLGPIDRPRDVATLHGMISCSCYLSGRHSEAAEHARMAMPALVESPDLLRSLGPALFAWQPEGSAHSLLTRIMEEVHTSPLYRSSATFLLLGGVRLALLEGRLDLARELWHKAHALIQMQRPTNRFIFGQLGLRVLEENGITNTWGAANILASASTTLMEKVLSGDFSDASIQVEIALARQQASLEMELHRQEAIQNERLRVSNANLAETMHELQLHQRALEAAAISIAHDVRSPIASIVLFLEASAYKLPNEVRNVIDTAVEALRDLNEAAGRMVSEFVQGASDGTFPQLSLRELMATEIDRLGDLANMRGITIHLATEEDFPIRVSRSSVESIIRNVLSNAVLHACAGSQVDVAINGDNDSLQIVVTNTLAHEAASDGSNATHDGTGMGLSVVKRLADRIGASVRIDTTPQTYSATILLPRKQQWRSSTQEGAPLPGLA